MKKILLLLALLPFQLSAQQEWSFAESNYKLSTSNAYVSLRSRDLHNNQRDYAHIELGYNPRGLEIAYRYSVDDNGSEEDIIENRWKFTRKLYEYGWFTLKTRMEYRDFNIKIDHWRFRWMFEYEQPIGEKLGLWAIIQPRWEVREDFNIDDWRNQFGIYLSDGPMKFGPFLERYSSGTNQGLGESLWFFAVNVEISL